MATEPKDGGYAFPIPDIYGPDGCGISQGQRGMSVRMYAAIHIAADQMASRTDFKPGWQEQVAWRALSVADALIAADRKERES